MTSTSSHPLLADSATRRRLTALAKRWLADAGEAEDLVQETYLRTADERILPGEAGRQAWLTTVLHRLCIDVLRRQRRYGNILQRESEGRASWDPDALPDRLVDQAQRVDSALVHLTDTLRPEDVAAVLLHEVFDMGHAELGLLTARGEIASRQHLSRLLRRVRSAPVARIGSPDDDEDRASLLELCRHAIVRRDAAGLVALLRTATPQMLSMTAPAGATAVPCGDTTQATLAKLVHADGQLTLAVFMDGNFLAWLPLGDSVLVEA